MSLEDEPGPEYVRAAMDERPLSIENEVRHLHEITDRLNVDPEFIIIIDEEADEQFTPAIRIVDRHTRKVLLYGFYPGAGEWVLVNEWTEDELTKADYDRTVNEWIERYGVESIEEE
jgi:hypothetical protein